MAFYAKVGRFTKITTVTTQAITGVGFIPKALIFFTMGATADATFQSQATADARCCVGFVSGTAATEQYGCSSTADTAGGGGRRQRQVAILLTDAGGATIQAECSLQSFDSDGFTLNWTTNTGEAQIIGYLALGGPVMAARVKNFTTPAGTGNFTVTGLGFRPNLVFFTSAVTGAIDTAAASFALRFGAAINSSTRWSGSVLSTELAAGAATRGMKADRCSFSVTAGGGATLSTAFDFVSMDADGCTINSIQGTAVNIGIIALQVPASAIGLASKPTGAGPATQTVTTGFQPQAVLTWGVQNTTNATPQNDGARVGISAFTASDSHSVNMSIPAAPGAISYHYHGKAAKAAVKVNNNTPAIDAEATLGAFLGDGFTLTWNANDAVATEFGYIAFGQPPRHSPRHRREVMKLRPRRSLPRGAFRRRTA